MTSKKVIIIGAGPAGLTAAYELLKDKDCLLYTSQFMLSYMTI